MTAVGLRGPRVWWVGARPRTLAASVAPVLVGTAAAASPSVERAVAALVVALGLQVGVNFANDYFDGVRNVDRPGRVGPTRLTASGLASPGAVRAAAAASFAVAFAVGTWLAVTTNPWLLGLGAAALAAAILYAGGPRPYGGEGLGEVSVFLFFGLLATAGTAYVQGGRVPAAAWWGALPLGMLAAAILVANNLRDMATDAAAGKNTLAVRLGERATRRLHRALVILALASPVAGVAVGSLPAEALLALAAAPVALRAAHLAGGATGADLIPVLVLTSAAELVFGSLLAAGIALARV